MSTSSIRVKDKEKDIESKFYTLDDYFRLEEKSLHKNEYHDGKIIPMAGAKLKHNRLAQRVSTIIDSFVMENNLNFIVSNSDTKIRIEPFNKVVYPDAVVICETPQYYKKREDTILNPLLIVEVLSTSTQRFDRTTKFDMYRTIESFKEYVMVYQDRQHIAVWLKQPDGSWLPNDYIGQNSTAILKTILDCPLALSKVYNIKL